MSLPGPSAEEVDKILCFIDDTYFSEDFQLRPQPYVQNLLEPERDAFLTQRGGVDQQVEKAKWTVVFAPEPRYTVILLHERGDFPQSLAKRFFKTRIGWDLREHCPSIKWVFPKAPASLYQFGRPPMWFPDPKSSEYRHAVEYSAAYLNYIVEQEAAMLDRGTGRVFLGGVQQGAAISIYSLLKQQTPLGGLVCVGGWLDPNLIPDITSIVPHRGRGLETPVYWLHDRLDPVVSVNEAHRTVEALRQRGVNVSYIEAFAGRIRVLRNRQLFHASPVATQIIRTLSGLHKIKIPSNSQKDSALAHGQELRSRYENRRRPSRLCSNHSAPFGELPRPGVIDYSLGRVPVYMAGTANPNLPYLGRFWGRPAPDA